MQRISTQKWRLLYVSLCSTAFQPLDRYILWIQILFVPQSSRENGFRTLPPDSFYPGDKLPTFLSAQWIQPILQNQFSHFLRHMLTFRPRVLIAIHSIPAIFFLTIHLSFNWLFPAPRKHPCKASGGFSWYWNMSFNTEITPRQTGRKGNQKPNHSMLQPATTASNWVVITIPK